jgi:beta-lactam-binding protein with PASTA domain
MELLVLCACSGGFGGPATVAVPNVEGMTQAAATTAITGAGLVLGTVTTVSSSTVPAGSVISESPAAATPVEAGSTVNLTVSSGAAPTQVPNVVGLTQSAATTAITGAGLVLGSVALASSSTVPAGSVISQSPAAGTNVAPDSMVNLTVSSGAAQTQVPNVVGLTQAVATTAITSAGLSLGAVTTQSSATVASGLVISESPIAGTTVISGSAVSLVVSSGPVMVLVPNVVGLTQPAATSAITGAGLVLGTVTMVSSATVPKGSVVAESPVAGTSVAISSAVNLSVSTGPARVAVPNVVGLTLAAATAAITEAGLVLGNVKMADSATVPSGSVISQSPAAATLVAPGSAVNLTVSKNRKAAAVINAPAAVVAYSTVILDGTSSVDSTATIQSYAWAQQAGPKVTLATANAARASFTAPQVTRVTSFTFNLTVTDSLGAASSTTATIKVSPASTAQLAVTFVAARFLVAVPANPHTDYTLADGPPLAGSTSEVQVTLTGAVQAPVFTLVDANGNVLSTPSLTSVGTPSIQPLTFAGSITVPKVPFTFAASGTTADGQAYSVQLPSLFVPMNMSISFSPSVLWLAPAATANGQLTIYNGGAAATFAIQYNDPSNLLSAGTATSVQIASGSSATVPITVTCPTTIAAIGPTVTATASVAGDATRTGTATLTLWQSGGP